MQELVMIQLSVHHSHQLPNYLVITVTSLLRKCKSKKIGQKKLLHTIVLYQKGYSQPVQERIKENHALCYYMDESGVYFSYIQYKERNQEIRNARLFTVKNAI